ncbi:unnamed protein product [Clonostachys rosea]|uniref:Uncharacterized protein n=1 Tax=Bionectria ochroleuca TaxID=29856 RepID=A0ABY6UB95_BIOOC|nr:unnamed protein product [Clonostachys rosea]
MVKASTLDHRECAALELPVGEAELEVVSAWVEELSDVDDSSLDVDVSVSVDEVSISLESLDSLASLDSLDSLDSGDDVVARLVSVGELSEVVSVSLGWLLVDDAGGLANEVCPASVWRLVASAGVERTTVLERLLKYSEAAVASVVATTNEVVVYQYQYVTVHVTVPVSGIAGLAFFQSTRKGSFSGVEKRARVDPFKALTGLWLPPSGWDAELLYHLDLAIVDVHETLEAPIVVEFYIIDQIASHKRADAENCHEEE